MLDGISTKRWNREQYYQMGDLGWFNGQRVQLIDGQVWIYRTQSFLHAALMDRTRELFQSVFGGRFWVRMQLALNLGEMSEPEPDVSVVTGTVDDYSAHPTSAVLVVEVSGTTLRFDSVEKSALYARSLIPEYWVVDLTNRQIEVYLKPKDGAYSEVQAYRIGDFVEMRHGPAARVEVAKIFGE